MEPPGGWFWRHKDLSLEGFVVTCPLASATSHLISSSCPSPRSFALDFLQTLPRVNSPPAKAGGFGLRLKAGSIGHPADCPDIHLRWYSTTPVHCSRPYTIYINSSLRRRPQSRSTRGVISLDAGLRRYDDLPPNGGGVYRSPIRDNKTLSRCMAPTPNAVTHTPPMYSTADPPPPHPP